MTSMGPNAEFLYANIDAYEWLLKGIDRRRPAAADPESVLRAIASTAHFAATFHAGRFADGAIENRAFEFGSELTRDQSPSVPQMTVARGRPGRRRVLHVTSHVRGIGGHTRMIHHWVQSDTDSCHSLLVTDPWTAMPDWLSESVRASGGEVTVLPASAPIRWRASVLRQAARQNADLVILHTDPSDVIPTVAFATEDGPPVALVNHADHLFWLGPSICDLAINLRTAGARHAAARRFVSANTVMPIPLADPQRAWSRQDARRTLGIPPNQIVLLSVGRAEKYRPCGGYDFIATASKILASDSRLHLYVVGESLAGIRPHLRQALHERMHFAGAIQDPSPYRAAADIYLESFPFGSQTALLEAALGGLPVVPAYAPLFPLLVANDDALLELISNPRDESEYIGRVAAFVASAQAREELGQRLRARLLVDHVGEGWLGRLSALYGTLERTRHRPAPIAKAGPRMTQEDIALSLWHVASDGRTYNTAFDASGLSSYRHRAFVAKDVGDYATARRSARMALRLDPFGRASWRLLGASLLGKLGASIRGAVRDHSGEQAA
jgi:glycosyltransferase involved in cell wall biosynthesis